MLALFLYIPGARIRHTSISGRANGMFNAGITSNFLWCVLVIGRPRAQKPANAENQTADSTEDLKNAEKVNTEIHDIIENCSCHYSAPPFLLSGSQKNKTPSAKRKFQPASRAVSIMARTKFLYCSSLIVFPSFHAQHALT